MRKEAKFDPPSVKHHQRRTRGAGGGGGGGGGVAAPLKIGVNSTKLTGCEEHVHFTRRVKQS